MPRWDGDSRARLEQAALDLFVAQGFEPTSVADIADRAGLTKRTFFRYFTDKREVLFGGQQAMEATMRAAIAGAPAQATPMAAATAGLLAAAELVDAGGDFGRVRYRLIAADEGLREREALKRQGLVALVTQELVARGAPQTQATVVAEVALATFTVAYQQWGLARSASMVDALTRVLADLESALRR